jgi:hypothetical protein
MNGRKGLYKLSQILPTSSLLHPEQALEIFFMNGKGRDVYKFLGAQTPLQPLPSQSRLLNGQGPPACVGLCQAKQ